MRDGGVQPAWRRSESYSLSARAARWADAVSGRFRTLNRGPTADSASSSSELRRAFSSDLRHRAGSDGTQFSFIRTRPPLIRVGLRLCIGKRRGGLSPKEPSTESRQRGRRGKPAWLRSNECAIRSRAREPSLRQPRRVALRLGSIGDSAPSLRPRPALPPCVRLVAASCNMAA